MILMWLNVHLAISNDTWGHIVGIQIRFMDDHLSGILLLFGQENGIASYRTRCCG